MEWEPPEQAWQTYVNFELRYKEIDRARTIWQRFLHVHGHDVKQWLRYAKFEERFGYIGNARAVSVLDRLRFSLNRLRDMFASYREKIMTKMDRRTFKHCDQ